MKGSVFKREAEVEEDEEMKATTLGTKIFGKHLHKVHITTTTTTEESFIDGKNILFSFLFLLMFWMFAIYSCV